MQLQGFCLYLCRMQQPWYKSWFNSPYYHKLYFQRDEKEAATFIDTLLGHLQPGAGSKMLDVACGKGRHARQMAEHGYDVTGIDLSPESIRSASEMEGGNLHFLVHDMRLPFWSHYFDFTFNLFTSFGYFMAQHENDSAMRMMAQSLNPGGKLIIDYLNAEPALKASIPEQKIVIEGTEFMIRKWSDSTHFHKSIVVSEESLKNPLLFTERVSKFSLMDFEQMFKRQHLKLSTVFGDYRLGEYSPKTSPRMIMIAERDY